MSINWEDLRPLNNSQNDAFEELCRQLARYERVPPNSVFTAKGDPDAGVECYWKFPSGDEWGWQAKFFRSSPDTGQWSQIDKSVKKALEKHPELVKYTICFPIDQPDARIKGKKSFMDKWNDHVEKWKEWAQEKGMSVEFEYWGEHEILERLSREEHRGRFFFWFNKEFFSKKWFERHTKETISCADTRYTPELNIELPIARLFDGLGRTSEFYTQIRVKYGRIKRTFAKVLPKNTEKRTEDKFDSLQEKISRLLSTLETIDETSLGYIDWDYITRLTSESEEIAWKYMEDLEAASKDYQSHGYNVEFGYRYHHLRELLRQLKDLEYFAQSNEARLSNIPALLIMGKAGTGKTHLFCDVAKQRIASFLPTILLLGERFTDEDPLSQIVKILKLSCSKEEFLGAFEAAAQARGIRGLIMIDALNEAENPAVWCRYTKEIVSVLSEYPHLGIALSVRSGFEKASLPKNYQDIFIVEEHRGFGEKGWEAIRIYFREFHIKQPEIPLLYPEFHIPLFLRLFCETFKRSKKLPKGHWGATHLFEAYIKRLDKELSREVGYEKNRKVLWLTIKRVAEWMGKKGTDRIPRSKFLEILSEKVPQEEQKMLQSMERHFLITKSPVYTKKGKIHHYVYRFPYQKFSDHLIVRYLLNEHLDTNNPEKSFDRRTTLGKLIRNEQHAYTNMNLLEALMIQIPERLKGIELTQIAPYCAEYYPVREAFVESLIWRDPKVITERTTNYINKHILKYKGTFNRFLDALLTIASDSEHPYNADFLHEQLMKYNLAARDEWWSIFIFEQYGEHRAVDRLVDWAWSPEDKSHINDESIRLCGTALAWFLTTSHRYLRDRATKALVNLLTKRIHALREIIYEFLDVNDPYVLERLLAVAYGCAMRSIDNNAVGELAQDIYEWIFKNGEPPPNILLRDYARGVIELALYRGTALDVDMEKVRPPYESEWPSEIPTNEELEKYRERWEGMPEEELARAWIYSSVMGFGDFARYVIGINAYHFPWSSHRLGEPRELTIKEMYERFVDSLTGRQRKAWELYRSSEGNLFRRFFTESNTSEFFEGKPNEKGSEDSLEDAEKSFRKTLSKKKLKIYEGIVVPYLNDPNRYRNEYRFDLSIAQRWILQRVFDLGWTIEYFGSFDRFVSRFYEGRQANKPERVGKKYQWIAYYEFLARVSDNFEFRGDSWSSRPEKYEGPWQVGYTRNIDPSCILKKTEVEVWEPHTSTWWFPSSYNAWDSEPDDVKWLKSSEDIPRIDSLIEVASPDGARWLTLRASFNWEQPTPPEEERFEIPRREIWCTIRSYIVKKSDIEELFKWAKKQDSMDWMPESHDLHGVFLGEFFWSPAYEYHSFEYSGYKEWTRGDNECIPKEVLITAEEYSWGHEDYDCSLDEGIGIYLPARWLVHHLGLRWNGVEGKFFDEDGNLIAFDPSVRAPGPGALLINRNTFLKFLNNNGYDILWTIVGEKNIIGEMARDEWKGRLKLSGAYRIHDGKLFGKVNKKFVS